MKILTIAALLSVLVLQAEALEKQTLWKAKEGGYRLYRIPGLIVTKAGTLLAYAEARRNTGSDWDTIDLVMRRSTDQGKTFSEQKVVAHTPDFPRSPVAIEKKQGKPDDVTYDNPVAIADGSGNVHFLFCRDYMRVFYTKSNDDGLTFSQPVEITSALDRYRPEYAWRVVALGPGHGIEMTTGRLVVPIWLSLGNGGNGHHPSVNSTIYSDDHGTTWQPGHIAVPDTTETPDPNETATVQLAKGPVMLNIRTASKKNRRLVVTSKDGAHRWSRPRYQEDLPDPICFGALTRMSTKKTADRNRILFANPDSLNRADGKDSPTKDRRNLTISMSYNEGKSWKLRKVLEPGPSAYSDLAVSDDGTIWCLYEMGEKSAYEQITLAKFNLEWLSGGKDVYRRKASK